MPHATISGLQIHYREAGEGFPVLLVHGYTGNSRNWALTVPELTRRFRTISLDLRGHGLSDKPTRREDYTIQAMADDVYGLIQSLGIGECFLVGHSMGGIVAQHFVLEHPERVRALALVDTAAERPNGMRMEQRRRLMAIAREKGMEAVFEEQLRSNPAAERIQSDPRFLENYKQQFLMTSLEAYLYCAEEMNSREPILDRLSAIQVPTLIICGEHDTPFLRPSRNLHERIRGSQLVIIDGAGHTPQIEKAAEFNHALMEFLARVHDGVAAGG